MQAVDAPITRSSTGGQRLSQQRILVLGLASLTMLDALEIAVRAINFTALNSQSREIGPATSQAITLPIPKQKA